MKRAFVRGIWGEFNVEGDIHLFRRNGMSARSKVEQDMELALLNKYEPELAVYVFGEDNYKRTIDMGFKDVRLIDKKPFVWDLKDHPFRHKIEIWHQALKDFDEIVFLDWDCIPFTKIPNDFWDVMGAGPDIQGALYIYHRTKNYWRASCEFGGTRTVIAATFLFLRGKTITQEMIDLWEKTGKPWSEESLISHYWDEKYGGWQGPEYYVKNNFHPKYHVFGHGFLPYEDVIFRHFNFKSVGWMLENKSNPEDVMVRLNKYYSNFVRDYVNKK